MIDFIKVSGAGTAEANNLYRQNGEINGKPYYENNTHEIKWSYDNRWEINAKSGNTFYMSDSDVATPDLATYNMTGVGVQPYPTVEMVSYEEFLKIKTAGSLVNFCYGITGIQNGAPKYSRSDNHLIQDSVNIALIDDGKGFLAWSIFGEPNYEGGVVPKYYLGSISNTPDLVSDWSPDIDGNLPNPIFSIGCPTFLSNSSKAVKRNKG